MRFSPSFASRLEVGELLANPWPPSLSPCTPAATTPHALTPIPLLCRAIQQPPPATLLSTTNPQILSLCSKTFPHILRLHVGSTEEGTGVKRGLKSARKRHVRCEEGVRKSVEEKEGRGDCELLSCGRRGDAGERKMRKLTF